MARWQWVFLGMIVMMFSGVLLVSCSGDDDDDDQDDSEYGNADCTVTELCEYAFECGEFDSVGQCEQMYGVVLDSCQNPDQALECLCECLSSPTCEDGKSCGDPCNDFC